MSGIANITVYDGATTPVAHTLVPISVSRQADGTVEALWRENNPALPLVAQVSLTFRLQRLKSGVYRTERVVEVPVMESVSGQNAAGYTAAPKVAYVEKDVRILFSHERSSVTDRRLCRMIGVNLDNNISTSVAAATSGPASEMFDSLIMPT